MSKFGELIDVKIPVLLDFYTTWDERSQNMVPVLLDVATAVGEKARVVKIDVEKNANLSNALRVKDVPTLIIYKDGEMMWRNSGECDADTIVVQLQKYA